MQVKASRKRCRVLVVDDEPAMREVLEARLDRWGFPVRSAASAAEARAIIDAYQPNLIISDLVLPDGTGLDLLRAYHHESRRFVLVTAYGTIDTAVQAMKGGAAEFLTKPLDYQELRGLIEAHDRSLWPESARGGEEERDPESDGADDVGSILVGRSAAMVAVRRQIAAVGASATTVLVVGESGTGKELVARAIHASSKRAAGPFVAVNAAAIPGSLVERELFGHVKGAFTGSDEGNAGFFEQANGGTLFLDEITEMPLELQPKLLRVLEDGCVRRLGATREIDCDVRVVAATNQSPLAAVEQGRLRHDLFHRLCVFRIDLPPVRERRDDIPLLARHLLEQLAQAHGREPPELGREVLALLQVHDYPGNVRELRNILERALVLANGREIRPEHVQPSWGAGSTGATGSDGITLPPGVTAAEAERILIVETLRRVGNNKAEAARRLALDVKTIRNKLKSFEQGS